MSAAARSAGPGAAPRTSPTTPHPTDAGVDLDAPGGQLRGDDVGGAALLERDLGVGVEVMPRRHQLVEVTEDLGGKVHGGIGGLGASVSALQSTRGREAPCGMWPWTMRAASSDCGRDRLIIRRCSASDDRAGPSGRRARGSAPEEVVVSPEARSMMSSSTRHLRPAVARRQVQVAIDAEEDLDVGG